MVRSDVRDERGQPLEGARIRVAVAFGTLLGGGSGTTGQDGRYIVEFDPGIHSDDPVNLQVACVSATMPGRFEHIGEAGLLMMANRTPDGSRQVTAGASSRWTDRCGVDFMLFPAARLTGQLVDSEGNPLAGYDLTLDGEALPPASSVLASLKTAEDRRFSF